ncbi:hypothetical protein [Curtobacterium sp. ISL-83]|uniref:hypothetical protein n=1 Tax=Curtobacterium sp. ISL-83 TaxID=2819145 RepID=UPI001BE5A79E|nr:hypothetical protein [Curtobacterium sp. ISL-83]MBT2503867.1 hypothetical protein [Curtobacterium sp. ISL-83]
MGNVTFARGWRLVRAHRSEFLDPAKVRRRTVVSGAVGVAVGTCIAIATLVWGVPEGVHPWDVLAMACFAGAVGCLTGSFMPVADRAALSRLSAQPRGDWRRSERIARQFEARPPAMLAEDRDEVLASAERAIGPAVVAASRTIWIPIGWLLAWAGLLLWGLATPDRLTLLLVPPVFGVLQSAAFIAAVTGAGRADAARQRAVALPPPSPRDTPLPRRADPSGSKVRLPGD